MMRYPKSKWIEKPESGYHGDESGLQQHLEQTCSLWDIECRRIPDSVWGYLKKFAPVGIVNALARFWKDKPDLLCLIPVDDKFSLAIDIELKAKKNDLTHGQRNYKSRMPVVVCRSPEESALAISELRCTVEMVSKFLKGDGDECRWNWDEDELWQTSCGETHAFYTEGSPRDHKHYYCPYCGNKIKEMTNDSSVYRPIHQASSRSKGTKNATGKVLEG